MLLKPEGVATSWLWGLWCTTLVFLTIRLTVWHPWFQQPPTRPWDFVVGGPLQPSTSGLAPFSRICRARRCRAPVSDRDAPSFLRRFEQFTTGILSRIACHSFFRRCFGMREGDVSKRPSSGLRPAKLEPWCHAAWTWQRDILPRQRCCELAKVCETCTTL